MRIIAPFTSLLFGILATTGNALKTLVIVNFPKERDMTSFRGLVDMSSIEQRDDVILLENPKNIADLRVKLGPIEGTFDRAVIQSHGFPIQGVPGMELVGNQGMQGLLKITDIISFLNQGNEETLEKIHLCACYIGSGFEEIVQQKVWSHYYEELQKSLQEGQILFVHGDSHVGNTGSFGSRLKGVVERENYSIYEAIKDSGEAMGVVVKKHGTLRGGSVLKAFSADPFGRNEEEFSSEEIQKYLDNISRESAAFEANNNLFTADLPPPPLTNFSPKKLDEFAESRFLSDAQKFLDEGDFDSIRLMLENGANPDSRYESGQSFLFLAAMRKNYATIANLFLEKGANIDLQDKNGYSVLMIASSFNQTESAKFFVENNADRDLQNNDGSTALMMASQNGNLEIVTALVSKGAKLNLRNKAGFSALFIAILHGHNEIVEFLARQHGTDINFGLDNADPLLMLAIEPNNIEVIKILLKYQADVTLKNQYGLTALDLALINRNEEIAELLIEHGGNDLNSANLAQKTALLFALESGQLKTAKLLIQKGADLNLADQTGFPPISYALRSVDNLEILELLLKNGADSNPEMPGGLFSLDQAVLYHREFSPQKDKSRRMIQLLIDYGARPSEEHYTSFGPTLINLVILGETEIVESLLKNGANVNVANESGLSPLMQAVSQPNNIETVKLLLKYGANPEWKDANGKTILDAANAGKDTEVIDLITQEIERRKEEIDPITQEIKAHTERGNLRGSKERLPKEANLTEAAKGIGVILAATSAIAIALNASEKKKDEGKTQ